MLLYAQESTLLKVFGFIFPFDFDRRTCIEAIRKSGYDAYATDMAATKRQTIKR